MNNDQDIRIRLAERLSSAGVGYNQVSLEILYLLPREFVDRYQELYESALGPAIRPPGDTLARDGELGRARTRTQKKGLVVGAGAGGSSKRWSQIFQVRSQSAFDLKSRIDRRLRAMAREIRAELMGLDQSGGRGSIKRVRQCLGCGKLSPVLYRFCPWDGLPLIPEVSS